MYKILIILTIPAMLAGCRIEHVNNCLRTCIDQLNPRNIEFDKIKASREAMSTEQYKICTDSCNAMK